MASWTIAPEDLDGKSLNALVDPIHECVLALQRRRVNLDDGAFTLTPNITYPCTKAKVADHLIPGGASAVVEWLGELSHAIDWLGSGGACKPAGSDLSWAWKFIKSTGSSYTGSSLRIAAFSSASWTSISGTRKLWSIRKRLYEVMKCIELLKYVKLTSAKPNVAEYIWAASAYYYSSTAQDSINTAYTNLDTKALSVPAGP